MYALDLSTDTIQLGFDFAGRTLWQPEECLWHIRSSQSLHGFDGPRFANTKSGGAEAAHAEEDWAGRYLRNRVCVSSNFNSVPACKVAEYFSPLGLALPRLLDWYF